MAEYVKVEVDGRVAIVITRIRLDASSRAIGSVMPTTPPLDAE